MPVVMNPTQLSKSPLMLALMSPPTYSSLLGSNHSAMLSSGTRRVHARTDNDSRRRETLENGPSTSGILGGDERTRTADPLLAKQVLYQLSYVPFALRG
jgi:hypothetical protein